MIVGIDSMVVVYAGLVPKKGSKKGGGSQQAKLADLKRRSNILLDELRESEDTVCLPTVAVSELLIPVDDRKRSAVIAALSRHFHCPPFDDQAAAIAARIWAEHKKLPANQQYDSRHVLKADAMIVASAKSFGARRFYTHDRKCRKLASLVMDSFDLPTKKYDLFADMEDD